MLDRNVKSICFLSSTRPVPSTASSNKKEFQSFKMKATIFGFLAVIAAAHANAIQWLPAPTTLVRTPSLDSAVVHSERSGGAFSYSTAENHAYAPVLQTVPVYRSYSIVPQYPQYPVYYPAHPSVISFHPGYYPTLAGVPLPGQGVPQYPGIPQHPGVNPQNPVEVESPADNAANEDLIQATGDNDTVTVDSA